MLITTTLLNGPKAKSKSKRPAGKSQADTIRELVESILDDSKAEQIVTLDLAGKTSIADYMIIASGTSSRHVNTLAHRVSEALKDADLYSLPPEGTESGDWIVVDAGDVIVHLFKPEMRELYNLEKMWSIALPIASLEVIG